MSSVAVVVPLYKLDLPEPERLSLERALQVLARYPIFFACPRSFAGSDLLQKIPHVGAEFFEDHCFSSVSAYNELLLNPDFYARWKSYEFMLIHQLDAWVFRDELAYWCASAYDYIGAPWMRRYDPRWESLTALRDGVVGRVYRYFDVRDGSTRERHLKQFYDVVGNGGFSLRRIDACVRALRDHSDLREEFVRNQRHSSYGYNEDVFFSIAVNRYTRYLRIPDIRVAARFALEHALPRGLRYAGGLPFGCHAWSRFAEQWRKVAPNSGLPI